jgi:hypothetical protein
MLSIRDGMREEKHLEALGDQKPDSDVHFVIEVVREGAGLKLPPVAGKMRFQPDEPAQNIIRSFCL